MESYLVELHEICDFGNDLKLLQGMSARTNNTL